MIVLLFGGKEILSLPYTDGDFYPVDPITTLVVPNYNKIKHYTIIFNTFVFMQLFNEINSRKLGAYEYNVFAGFFNNLLFLVILIFTIAVQVAMVQYGGQPVRTVPLTSEEHGICIAIGASTMFISNSSLFLTF